MNRTLVSTAVALIAAAGASLAPAQVIDTIGYQGRLSEDGSALTGRRDLRFRLFDAPLGGSQIGDTATVQDVQVQDGLFSVQLPFDAEDLEGQAAFLQIEVFDPDTSTFVALSPRQPVGAAPYALALPGMRTRADLDSPGVIGGSPSNSIFGGVIGGTIAGGGSADAPNIVADPFGFVGGGRGNEVRADLAAVVGGEDNFAHGNGAGVVAGSNNFADGFRSFVGAGEDNDATGIRAAIVTGQANSATAFSAFVGGGRSNAATGNDSVVPGGAGNEAAGEASFAAGTRAHALHDGAFVWADSLNADFSSGDEDVFAIRASGGVGIGTGSPEAPVHIVHSTLTADRPWSIILDNIDQAGFITGMRNTNAGFFEVTNDIEGFSGFARLDNSDRWTQVSDARAKHDVKEMESVLDKVLRLRAVSFEYNGQDNTEHIGFVAQEVKDLFPSLVVDGELLTMDYSGLSVVAIKALQEQQAEIEGLRAQVTALLEKLEAETAD